MTTITTTQSLPTERIASGTRNGLWRSAATFAAGVALAAGVAAGINLAGSDTPAARTAPAAAHTVATPACPAHGAC